MELNTVTRSENWIKLRHVLISVADKRGLDTLIEGLTACNEALKLYSTGGTYARINEILGPERAKRHLVRVADYTRQPEMQGGLVKSLDFKIYLGLLSESFNEAHDADLKRTGAVRFDATVVNLYPFEKTIADPAVSLEQARANIDIGGPCMLRASAKNFLRVAVLCNPEDYSSFIADLKQNQGKTALDQRFELARRAFRYSAAYDRTIAAYLTGLASDLPGSTYTTLEREDQDAGQ